MSIEITMAVAGALSTMIAALTSALSQKVKKEKYDLVAANAEYEPTIQERLRVSEAKNELTQLVRRQNLLQISNISLVSGQFIIGGLLASSFLQEHLSPVILGSLGLVVLLSTMINQKFSPDAHYRVTKEKVIFLKRSIRDAEDMIFFHENEEESIISIFDIRMYMTECLNRIESTDFTESIERKHNEKGSNQSEQANPITRP